MTATALAAPVEVKDPMTPTETLAEPGADSVVTIPSEALETPAAIPLPATVTVAAPVVV
jgi:hypothetical protein